LEDESDVDELKSLEAKLQEIQVKEFQMWLKKENE